jgi:hypothetical protein
VKFAAAAALFSLKDFLMKVTKVAKSPTIGVKFLNVPPTTFAGCHPAQPSTLLSYNICWQRSKHLLPPLLLRLLLLHSLLPPPYIMSTQNSLIRINAYSFHVLEVVHFQDQDDSKFYDNVHATLLTGEENNGSSYDIDQDKMMI